MTLKSLFLCGAAGLLLTAAGAEALAQGRGGGAPPATSPSAGARDMDRTRDRIDTPDQDRLRDRDRDATGDRDQDRIRDRLTVDQAETQVGAWALLTDAERTQFREQIRTATTAEERERIRAQHRETVEQRARELGVDAPFGKRGASTAARQQLLMAQLLTEQERERFREQIGAAATEQERERIREEHRETIRDRAREMGMEFPTNFGQRPRR